MARREVEPGQRYRQPGASAVWVVVDLIQDAEGIPHARLVRGNDATSVKMISVSALKDSKLYRPAEEVSGFSVAFFGSGVDILRIGRLAMDGLVANPVRSGRKQP